MGSEMSVGDTAPLRRSIAASVVFVQRIRALLAVHGLVLLQQTLVNTYRRSIGIQTSCEEERTFFTARLSPFNTGPVTTASRVHVVALAYQRSPL